MVKRRSRRQSNLVNYLLLLILLGLLFCLVFPFFKQQEKQEPQTEVRKEFIARIAPLAQAEQRKYRIKASITIAQAALESDWGQSQLASKYNNLFGVKRNEQDGTLLATKEYVNGQWITVEDYFVVYPSWKAAVEAHSKLFVDGTGWDHNHYQAVLEASDYKQAAQALQERGYATDPNYAAKLIELIEQYQLDSYD